MKEEFGTTRFSDESRKIIRMAETICNNYARQGYDLSLRQLYYQFISKDYFPNTEQSYKRLGSIISDARVSGMIDWDMIKDRGRETVSNNHWQSPADILEACARQFRYDTWQEQPNYVEVMVEKQALEGVLEPVCRELDIRFTANKGYSSSSALYETGKRLQAAFLGSGSLTDYDFSAWRGGWGDYEKYFKSDETLDYETDDTISELEMSESHAKWAKAEEMLKAAAREFMLPHPTGGKALHVLYLGDHDPSGIDMTRDVKERLEMFSRCPVTVHRLALNMPQIERYNPPPNPAKMTDSRATDYVKKFGATSWELDALEPSLLARLVRSIVSDLRDDSLHQAAVARQDEARRRIKEMAAGVRSEETSQEETDEEEED